MYDPSAVMRYGTSYSGNIFCAVGVKRSSVSSTASRVPEPPENVGDILLFRQDVLAV